MHDRNFDDISQQFARNIYGTSKGKIREIIVWQDIERMLSQLPNRPLMILDAGGGQGQIACRLAQLGHQVILCDISAMMLAAAEERAQAMGVTLTCYHCAIQDVISYLKQPVDLILCHAVLEWVNEPQPIIATLAKLLAPDGQLSLMFYNYYALLFKTITLGNFGYAQTGLSKRKKKTLSPDHPRKPEEVYHWLHESGLTIISKTGIRVFHDYMLNKQKQQDAFDELLMLEQRYCQQEPYLSLARYINVIAKKETPLLFDKVD